MVSIHRITHLSAEQYPPAHSGLPNAEPDLWRSHAPDVHCVLIDRELVVAHCSLWWSSGPSLPGEKLGIIGHYAALDRSSGATLLHEAVGELQKRGCSLAVGPMDGNTWRRYRLVTERGSEPPFILEPDNPDDWPNHFVDSGFSPLAHYTSTLNENVGKIDERIERARQRLLSSGIVLRDFQPDMFESELRRIYAVSAVSFQDNFLYTPLPEEQFVAQYLRLRERIRTELILLAERDGCPVGYVFGIPNWLQASRNEPINTVVLKTVAILPGKTFGGLGNVLVHEVQQRARDLGFSRVIHALMHTANNSRNLSSHYAATFRHYTLFSRRL